MSSRSQSGQRGWWTSPRALGDEHPAQVEQRVPEHRRGTSSPGGSRNDQPEPAEVVTAPTGATASDAEERQRRDPEERRQEDEQAPAPSRPRADRAGCRGAGSRAGSGAGPGRPRSVGVDGLGAAGVGAADVRRRREHLGGGAEVVAAAGPVGLARGSTTGRGGSRLGHAEPPPQAGQRPTRPGTAPAPSAASRRHRPGSGRRSRRRFPSGPTVRAVTAATASPAEGALRVFRNATIASRSGRGSSWNRAATSTASPPWSSIASSSVAARPSWRYGAESATPQSGAVRHSAGVGCCGRVELVVAHDRLRDDRAVIAGARLELDAHVVQQQVGVDPRDRPEVSVWQSAQPISANSVRPALDLRRRPRVGRHDLRRGGQGADEVGHQHALVVGQVGPRRPGSPACPAGWPGAGRGSTGPSSLAQAALTKSSSEANSGFQPNRPTRPSASRATRPRILPSLAPFRPTRRAAVECSRWCGDQRLVGDASIRPSPKRAGVFRWVTTTSVRACRCRSISSASGIDGACGRPGWTRSSVSWNSGSTAFWWTTPERGSPCVSVARPGRRPSRSWRPARRRRRPPGCGTRRTTGR